MTQDLTSAGRSLRSVICKVFLWLGVLALVVAACIAFWIDEDPEAASAAVPPPAVPVHVARAERRNVPIYLTGVGTVQAFNTVTVRTQIQGELTQVLFREGQDVAKGQLLAVVDPRPYQASLDEADAKLQQDQANLSNARLVLNRYTQLGADAYASAQIVDNQRSLVGQLTALVAEDQAAISMAQTQLSYTQITAPLAGRTGIRLVDQGNIVHPTDTTGLVVVTQLEPVSVISTLPERDVERIRTALMAGTVEAKALSRDDGSVLDVGTVGLVDNEIDPGSGTVRLKSTFPNKARTLWPGQFVDTAVLAETVKNAVTVPSEALQRGPDGYFVYVVEPGGTVEPATVRPGHIANKIAIVDSGLDAGQTVVSEGQYRLAAGMRIAVIGGAAATATN